MRRARAFFIRDLRIAASYPASFALTLVGGVVTLTVFYFLARTIGQAQLPARYGSDYFSFALVGISMASALRSIQTSFAQRVKEAQSDGSLELLLASPLSTFRAIAYLSLYPTALAMFRAFALMAAGTYFFGAHFTMHWAGLIGSLALGILTFVPLGLLSAAFVLTFKRGDPFTYLLDVTSYLFAGVLYPVEILPVALQKLSLFLPATHALAALRLSSLSGHSPRALFGEWAVLLAFAVLLWPIAAIALSLARRHVEHTGTLPHT